MKSFFLLALAGGLAAVTGAPDARREPPCRCEVTVHKKKRKGVLPCIVGVLRDSATQKPLGLAALDINKTVSWTNKEGRTYTDVITGKHILTASAFTYHVCTQQVVAREGDSIVCVFNLRRYRGGSDDAGDFIHRRPGGLLRRLFPGK